MLSGNTLIKEVSIETETIVATIENAQGFDFYSLLRFRVAIATLIETLVATLVETCDDQVSTRVSIRISIRVAIWIATIANNQVSIATIATCSGFRFPKDDRNHSKFLRYSLTRVQDFA